MVGELKERLFAGDVTALVSHLLSEHEVSAAELAGTLDAVACGLKHRPCTRPVFLDRLGVALRAALDRPNWGNVTRIRSAVLQGYCARSPRC